ncbi:MAG: hypothetical protein AAF720_05500 [Pseudomonadota bacterium]
MRSFEIAAPATICAAFLSAMSFALSPTATAGDITVTPEGTRVYAFNKCEAPEPYVISEEDEAKFDKRPRKKRRALRRYDAYVTQLNVYFDCIQDEAQGDLDAVYGAVNGELVDRQNTALDRVTTLRKQLRLDDPAVKNTTIEKVAPAQSKADQQLEDELLGAE